jgi:hypothetical protein
LVAFSAGFCVIFFHFVSGHFCSIYPAGFTLFAHNVVYVTDWCTQ